jgi:hypothetical protein
MIPDRGTLATGLLIALTPVAGVLAARFVGHGPRLAAAASAVVVVELPSFPTRETAEPDRTDPAGLRSPFRVQTEPAAPALILPEIGQPAPRIEGVPEFSLTTVMPNPIRPLAVINGRPRALGDEAAPGWVVTGIDGDARRVTLTGPDGRTVSLGMRSASP